MTELERPPVTHVAIRHKGQVWSLPAPFRHHHVIEIIHYLTGGSVDARDEDQGFLDASGYYLNRKQALGSAELNDQLKPSEPVRLNMLFSENVW